MNSRRVMDAKQALMARYHLELPLFRLFLDDPASTAPEACRTIVGVAVEGEEAQRELRNPASELRDLVETVFGDELRGDALMLASENLQPDKRTDPVAGLDRPVGRVRVPPELNFLYIEGPAKSFLSAWIVPRAAALAFAQHAGGAALRWPRLQFEDRWWLGMGPGAPLAISLGRRGDAACQLLVLRTGVGPGITVMQPDSADGAATLAEFASELYGSTGVSVFGEAREKKR